MMSVPIVEIGKIHESDTVGKDLHLGSQYGNKKLVKKAVGKGVHVDYSNSLGQTPLYVACFGDNSSVVTYLLAHGANPNERSNDGSTPVHVAAYNGNVKIMVDLIAAGGDLRLHDHNGRKVKDWSLAQPDPKKRFSMIEFLEKSTLFAMTHSAGDVRRNTSRTRNSRRMPRIDSVLDMIRRKLTGAPSVDLETLRSCQSMGFGKVYLDSESTCGFLSTIPLVNDSCIEDNAQGLTFENGPHMVMESAFWYSTPVTIKRLHTESGNRIKGDFLITEVENLGKIKHPSILLLMGVCQSNTLDRMVLLFEKISKGSLFYFLHEKFERMSTAHVYRSCRQICDALIFLHDQNYIHSFLTSHAVFLTEDMTVKVGNLEYMIEKSKAKRGKKSFVVYNMQKNAAYNWMAPELMNEEPPSSQADMYSFGTILWEMLQCEIPWGHYEADEIRKKLVVERKTLKLQIKCPSVFQSIVGSYLHLDPIHRDLPLSVARKVLKMTPESADDYLERLDSKKHAQETFYPKVESSVGTEYALKQHDMTMEQKTKKSNAGSAGKGKKPARPNKSPQSSKYKKQREHNEIESHNHNQSSKGVHYPDLTDDELLNSYRFKDKVSFDINNTKWNLQEEQIGGDYYYTTGLERSDYTPRKKNYAQDFMEYESRSDGIQSITHEHTSSSKRHDGDSVKFDVVYGKGIDNSYYGTRDPYHHKRHEIIDKEIAPSESSETTSTQFSQEIRPLDDSSTKSLGSRISYLEMQKRSPVSKGGVIKPASHCTAPHIEKAPDNLLSMAGSVYALYNKHYGDNTSEKTPHKPSDDLNVSLYGTMPRKRKCLNKTPKEEESLPLGSRYLQKNGSGSVRDLVNLYTKQENTHKFRQAVLDGHIRDYSQNGNSGGEFGLCKNATNKNESPHKAAKKHLSLKENRIDQIQTDLQPDGEANAVNDLGYDKTMVCSSQSGAVSIGSDESEQINQWVDKEVKTVQSQLSEEIFRELSQQKMADAGNSPDLFESPNKNSSASENHRRDKKRKHAKKIDKECVKEFYFDDELGQNIQNSINMQLYSSSNQDRDHRRSSFINLSLDDQSNNVPVENYVSHHQSLQDSTTPDFENLQDRNKARGSYVSTVVVKSNKNKPKVHTITHTLTDLQKGTSSMMYEKTVTASKVVSAFFAP